jgi:hypothetical protein
MRMKSLTPVNVPSIYDVATVGNNVPKGKAKPKRICCVICI